MAIADQQLAKLMAALPAASVAVTATSQTGTIRVHVSAAAYAIALLAALSPDQKYLAMAKRLHDRATALQTYPVDAKARLLSLVANRPGFVPMQSMLSASLLSAIHETADAATVATDALEGERLLLPSDTKSTALVLTALLSVNPTNTLVPKLAKGTLGLRQSGRWRSTQDNIVALRALRNYFNVYEKTTPNFTAKSWIGDAAYAETSFVGRTTKTSLAHIDWPALPGSQHDVVISKQGDGRVYYRVGITYAPTQTAFAALDAGFVVTRSYAAVDKASDVARDRDGNWQVALGARVMVTVNVTNTTPRFGVALVDQLPAGFEAINSAIATAESGSRTTSDYAWRNTNHRDNRVETFAMNLAAGSHQFQYEVRATTPGTFFTAPAKAEEMYAPETFGRSSGFRLIVR
jgi:alpha-2-macroglobulin